MLKDKIRRYRWRSGISQEELALRSGLSARTIRYIESGQTARPRPATIRLIAAGLGVSVDDVDPRPTSGDPPVEWPPAPAQLPADPPGFVGRDRQLAALRARIKREGVVVATLTGVPGIGKTALAVRLAYQVANRFPAGALCADLRGSGPAPAEPAAVLRDFLEALGVPGDRIPAGIDARVGLFRSLLAVRRMIVLLDDARDGSQVRPLLPTSAGCVGLVTSRSPLADLVVSAGAYPVAVRALPRSDARAVLAARLGAARVAGERGAVRDLADRCSGLPIALAVVAAHAASRPDLPLTRLAGELRTGSTLSALLRVYAAGSSGDRPAA